MILLQGLAPVDSQNFDNPFVIRQTATERNWAWLRFGLLVVFCSAAVYGIHEFSQQWLISRLAYGLESHPTAVQSERLVMLAEFGEPSLPHLLNAVVSPHEELAGNAFKVVSQMQGRWQTSPRGNASHFNQALVTAIGDIIPNCAVERRPRLARLLDHIIMDTVEPTSTVDTVTYQRANELLAIVGGSPSRQEPRLASLNSAQALRPVAPNGNEQDSSPVGFQVPSVQSSPSSLAPTGQDPQRNPPGETSLPGDIRGTSWAGTAPNQSESESLTPQAPVRALQSNVSLAQPVPSHLVVPSLNESSKLTQIDQPLAAYETRSVIEFLDSSQAVLRDAAIGELRQRGFNAVEIELAMRLTSRDLDVRLALVEELGTRSDTDPQQWLLWLASDPERDVRLQAIARLGTMSNAEVTESLRRLLNQERDPLVATRLRRLLGLR